MPHLILIRHSTSQIDKSGATAAHIWPLSSAGRARCTALAERLRRWQPGVIVASVEPKASETGQRVARILGIPFETAEGLHEHERRNVPFYAELAQFEAAVRAFFAGPDKPVFGGETADGAHARFVRAVNAALTRYPDTNLAIATHGTVMTLFISRAIGIDPFPFWQRLQMPAFAVLALPGPKLSVVEYSVTTD